MSKTLREDNYYTRWSEPTLQRRSKKKCQPSDDEISSTRRSRSSSPLLNPRRSTSLFETCCKCRCNGKNNFRIQSKKSNGTRIKTQRIRESLELQLIGTQVEEALAGDRQAALIQHLDLATNTLEALIQHVQSLEISHLAAYRVLDFSHRLVIPYPESSNFHSSLLDEIRQAEILKENRLSSLKSIMDICTKNVIASERLQAVIDENKSRRDDFSIAARNLKNLLENSKLSMSQMEKLHRQYETILMDYRESRRNLDAELPKIVRTRLEAICQSFRLIDEFYRDSEYGKEMACFFKLISENLCNDESVLDHPSCQAAPPEMCQKCKVNRVDKQ